jgi:DNA-directed RNA polymerase specialized sigma24 family protein
MSQFSFALLLLTFLSLASIALWVVVGLHLARLTRTMDAFRERFEQVPMVPEILPSPEAEGRFANALQESEIKQHFRGAATREPPEKYRYVASLVERGLSAVEIAQTLHLSLGEVEQLMALTQLARRSAAAAAPPPAQSTAGGAEKVDI